MSEETATPTPATLATPATPALETALGAHPFLHGVSGDGLRRLATCARELSFPAGAFLLREGGEADAVHLLTAGRVVLEVQVPAQGPVRVEMLGPGDIVGIHWFFPPRRWVLDARCVEPVTSIALDAARLRAMLDEDPALGYAVTTRLLEQLYHRLERVRLQRLDVYGARP